MIFTRKTVDLVPVGLKILILNYIGPGIFYDLMLETKAALIRILLQK